MRFTLESDEINTVWTVFNNLLKTHKTDELSVFLDNQTIRDMVVLFGNISWAKYYNEERITVEQTKPL